MRSDDLLRLEEDLRKIPGITHARVVGEERPTEIHIVASPQRSPKQLVRDVQSLAAAGFGMPIDHRIVSIVRLDEAEPAPVPPPPPPIDLRDAVDTPGVSRVGAREPAAEADPAANVNVGAQAPPVAAQAATQTASQATPPSIETERRPSAETEAAAPSAGTQAIPTTGREAVAAGRQAAAPKPDHNGLRPVLDRVIVASKGNAGWVKVGLKWPNGRETEGAGSAGASRETRARGACAALIKALQPVLQERGAALEIDHIGIQPIDSGSSVVIKATFYEGGNVTPVLGSAIVQDDVASAAVRALLQATNRKLR